MNLVTEHLRKNNLFALLPPEDTAIIIELSKYGGQKPSGSNTIKKIQVIKKLVAEQFSICVDDLYLKSRRRSIVLPRQVCAYFIHKVFGLATLSDTANCFENAIKFNEHTNIIYACNTVQSLMEYDEDLKYTIMILKNNILETFKHLVNNTQ